MKFNITFDILGPSGKIITAPNRTNPVEAESLGKVSLDLSGNLPHYPGFAVKVVGVKVEMVMEDKPNAKD